MIVAEITSERGHSRGAQSRGAFARLSQHALFLASAFACVGRLASLLLSEVRGWMPCVLCWYQRICLWPLCLILGLAWLRGRSDISGFVLPQVAVGMAIATCQVFIQQSAHRDLLGFCPAGLNCATKVDVDLGPVSIPMLSLGAFVAMDLLLLAALRQTRRVRQ